MAQAAAVATVVSILGSVYYTEKTHQAEKKATKRANRLAKEGAAIEQASQQEALKETERKNRNLLAQQQASYKARLGVSGLSSRSGSAQVVLDTMKKESDMEDKYEQTKTQYSLKSLNNRLQQTNSRNLLSLNKTRIDQQKNALNAISGLGKLVE